MNVSAFDCIIAPTLILLAWLAMRIKDLFVGIVLFILFGLLTALTWVELQAPDIALVEAAIGAGVVGALFLGCLGIIESRQGIYQFPMERKRRSLLWIPVLSLAAILCWSISQLPPETQGLGNLVRNSLLDSGVTNPVTAVILNFRGYDTLLEIGVLFLAAVAIVSLRFFEPAKLDSRLAPNSRVFLFFLQLLTPSIVLVSAYLLWQGTNYPGGAFQAGAILTGGGVLLLLAKVSLPLDYRNPWLRLAVVSGFAGFLLTGLGMMGIGMMFLEYPVTYAKWVIVLIEILATVSSGLILLTLFSGCAGFLGITRRGGDGTL